MSQQTTNQATDAQGSYISIAASITSKLRCFCCTDSCTTNTTSSERPITVTSTATHEKLSINDALSINPVISLEIPPEE